MRSWYVMQSVCCYTVDAHFILHNSAVGTGLDGAARDGWFICKNRTCLYNFMCWCSPSCLLLCSSHVPDHGCLDNRHRGGGSGMEPGVVGAGLWLFLPRMERSGQAGRADPWRWRMVIFWAWLPDGASGTRAVLMFSQVLECRWWQSQSRAGWCCSCSRHQRQMTSAGRCVSPGSWWQ